MRTIGILGGTFDPIHFGHLRTALEVVEVAALDELRLLPCSQPPHRDAPQASGKQRLQMLEQAIHGQGHCFKIDRRELDRPGPSYMVDTLLSLRSEESGCSLNLVMGWDAFLGLSGWHRWQGLLELANLIVMNRPGSEDEPNRELGHLLSRYEVDGATALRRSQAGAILRVDVTPQAISATDIRRRLIEGADVSGLLPDPVLSYIKHEGLYC